MLKYFSILFLFPALLGAQAATQFNCGTEHQEILLDRITENRTWMDNNINQSKSKAIQFVPVKYHLLANNEGEGRIDLSDMLDEICFNNQVFEDTEFIFYIKDGFNLRNDDLIYRDPRSSTSNSRMLNLKNSIGRGAVNIFITQSAGESGVLGFYNPSSDVVVAKKTDIGVEEKTLVHELGHYFSLPHTHLGWDRQPYDADVHGRKVTINSMDGIAVELMDGSNCGSAGDRMCDTPPDYNFGFGWPNSCPRFNQIVEDANGDTIVPSQGNIMSYFFGCDSIHFSKDQIDVMVADYNSGRRSTLRTSYVPDTSKITEDLSIITPTFNQRVDFFNGVKIQWTQPPNATDYYIKIRGAGKEFTFLTQDSEIFINVLEPNVTYNLLVHPFNETGGCAESQSTLFKTSDASTSTVDPRFVNNVEIYPNPVSFLNELNIRLNAEQPLDAVIEWYDVHGKRSKSQSQRFRTGQNDISINTSEFDRGLYFLVIKTEKGNLSKKIILN